MSAPVAHHRYTFTEYLELEEVANVKHEFYAGEIYALAGGTPAHAALAANVCAALVPRVAHRGCQVFTSDLRVRVLATGLASYPDVTVVCGDLERDPESRLTVVNPILVVEVLSDGTEDYDRAEKVAHYKQVATLRHCLLLSHREPCIDAWSRDASGSWACVMARASENVALGALGCEVSVDEIYRGVVLDDGS